MFNFFGGYGGVFEATYRALPVAFIDKPHADEGDKVILPPSALDRLASLHIEYPMLFRVENSQTGRHTHCGVLEFVADEGVVYMPHWMMQNLLLEVGDMVKFRNVSLQKGTYCKLQPVTSDFLDISNPKAVLERTLRGYSCLTKGDCFVINYNNKKYEMEVKETRPGDAISVIETDCQVDFDPPKDYKEPERAPPQPKTPSAPEPMQDDKPATATAAEEEEELPKFIAFTGSGRRLDGKPPVTSGAASAPSSTSGAAATTSGRSASAAGEANGTAAVRPPGAKAGKFVGPTAPVGNRLLAKLEKERAAKQGAAPPPPPPPPEEEAKEEASKDNVKPFSGKAYRLTG